MPKYVVTVKSYNNDKLWSKVLPFIGKALQWIIGAVVLMAFAYMIAAGGGG